MEASVLALVQFYRDAQKRIGKLIEQAANKGTSTRRIKEINRQIDAETRKLNRQIALWASRVVRAEYLAGVLKMEEQLENAFVLPSFSFGLIHQQAVAHIVESVTADTADVNRYVGRRAKDAVARISKELTALKMGTGSTQKQFQKALLNRIAQEGISAIPDKNGRNMNLKWYAEMVGRTTVSEAANLATITRAKELGYDLVRVTKHAPTCSVCAVLQDRVYTITGNTPGYPLLSSAFPAPYYTIHPNCKCRLTLYIPSLDMDLANTMARTNRPMELSQEEAESVARYHKIQQKKRLRAADRREYENIKAYLPDSAPKTFSGFRSMKRAKSEAWKELRADYRYIRKQIDNKIAGAKIKLTDSEHGAIKRYISADSYLVNEKLRQGIALEAYEQEYVQSLDNALERMPVYQGVVSRSLDFFEEEDLKAFISAHEAGKVVRQSAYTSATIGKRYNPSSRVEMAILSKNGRDLREYNPEEQEVLFQRNTRFQVLDRHLDKSGTWIIIAEEVDK